MDGAARQAAVTAWCPCNMRANMGCGCTLWKGQQKLCGAKTMQDVYVWGRGLASRSGVEVCRGLESRSGVEVWPRWSGEHLASRAREWNGWLVAGCGVPMGDCAAETFDWCRPRGCSSHVRQGQSLVAKIKGGARGSGNDGLRHRAPMDHGPNVPSGLRTAVRQHFEWRMHLTTLPDASPVDSCLSRSMQAKSQIRELSQVHAWTPCCGACPVREQAVVGLLRTWQFPRPEFL